ncbi:MAG: tetratricopeptide repeat protein [Planctomycetes bacterium]|nr:tetratricopeptide repeat protein [Planctomycetota bacterium]
MPLKSLRARALLPLFAAAALLCLPLAAQQNRVSSLQQYIEQEKWDSALPILKDLLAKHPDDASLWLLCGEAYSRLNDPLNAHVHLRRYLRLAPFEKDRDQVVLMLEATQARLMCLAAERINAGEFAAADSFLREVEQARPDSPAVHFNRALCMAAAGLPLEAFARLALCAHYDPSSADRVAARRAALQPALDATGLPPRAVDAFADARVALAAGKLAEAGLALDNALESAPEQPDFLYYKALVLARSGRPLPAVAWLSAARALSADAEQRKTMTALVESLLQAVRLQQAAILGEAFADARKLPGQPRLDAFWHLVEASAAVGSTDAINSFWRELQFSNADSPFRDAGLLAMAVFYAPHSQPGLSVGVYGRIKDLSARDEAVCSTVVARCAPRNLDRSSAPPADGAVSPFSESFDTVVLPRPCRREIHPRSITSVRAGAAGRIAEVAAVPGRLVERGGVVALLDDAGGICSTVPGVVEAVLVQPGELVLPFTTVCLVSPGDWTDFVPTLPGQQGRRLRPDYSPDFSRISAEADTIVSPLRRCRAFLALAAMQIDFDKHDAAHASLRNAADAAEAAEWTEGYLHEHDRTFARLCFLQALAACPADVVLHSAAAVQDVRGRDLALVNACFAAASRPDFDQAGLHRLAAAVSKNSPCAVGALAGRTRGAESSALLRLKLKKDVLAAASSAGALQDPADKAAALLFFARACLNIRKPAESAAALKKALAAAETIDDGFSRGYLFRRAAVLYRDSGDGGTASAVAARSQAALWLALARGGNWRGRSWAAMDVVASPDALVARARALPPAQRVHRFADIALLHALAAEPVFDLHRVLKAEEH